MVCPSMWISVTEKTGACPELCVLPAGCPALQWPSAVSGRTSCVWCCLFTLRSAGFICSKDSVPFLLTANQVRQHGCCFSAVTLLYLWGATYPVTFVTLPLLLAIWPPFDTWLKWAPWLMRSMARRGVNEVAQQAAREFCTLCWHHSCKLQGELATLATLNKKRGREILLRLLFWALRLPTPFLFPPFLSSCLLLLILLKTLSKEYNPQQKSKQNKTETSQCLFDTIKPRIWHSMLCTNMTYASNSSHFLISASENDDSNNSTKVWFY